MKAKEESKARGLLQNYRKYLNEEEKSAATIEKYLRDVTAFQEYLGERGEREVRKETVVQYKRELSERYKARSVNSILAALNSYFRYLGCPECRIRPVKVQNQLFCARERELSRQEYQRLLLTAQGKGRRRLLLILQTICSTGIRVSELRFITRQAVRSGVAEVRCKGKTRRILLPQKLRRLLERYASEQGIVQGSIFITRGGNPVNRSNIWAEMKSLCREARVSPEKVFPHNLRHLFARTYYKQEKDLSHLADLLGHSNTATTRLYTMSSGAEHARQIERLNLLL